MTRGNFVLICKDAIYSSLQFNGDMYPSCNGKYVYHMLKAVNSIIELKQAICKFDDLRFGYARESGEDVGVLNKYDNLDFSVDYFKRYNSDYLYIKNADVKPYTICDRDKKNQIIHPGEIQIWGFGEYEEADDEELSMTPEEMAEIAL